MRHYRTGARDAYYVHRQEYDLWQAYAADNVQELRKSGLRNRSSCTGYEVPTIWAVCRRGGTPEAQDGALQTSCLRLGANRRRDRQRYAVIDPSPGLRTACWTDWALSCCKGICKSPAASRRRLDEARQTGCGQTSCGA
jgi:hypothetical protein